MKRFIKTSLICLALLVFIYGAGFLYYKAPGPLTQETHLIYKRGMGFRELIGELGAQDVVRFPYLFAAIAVASNDAHHLKAGEYAFSAASSPQTVLNMLKSGQVVIHKLTVAEGLRVSQVVELINEESVLEGALPATIAEGSLLPETYYFTYGDTRAQLVSRMQESMQHELAMAWAKRAQDVPFASPQEALILASIVEKETGVDEERARVAAVFINRMRIGMKLQSDPTTVYGIEQAHGPMERSLTANDLKTPTPYNTYTIDKLPPTPIANPGRASLEATLNPAKTNDLYFVATGTGGHHFAATLEAHNANVKAYREALTNANAE